MAHGEPDAQTGCETLRRPYRAFHRRHERRGGPRRRRHRLRAQGALCRPGAARHREPRIRSLPAHHLAPRPDLRCHRLHRDQWRVYPFYDQFADIVAQFHRERAAASPMATVFVDIVRSGLYDVSGSIDFVDSPRHKVYANVLTSMKALKKSCAARMGWKAPARGGHAARRQGAHRRRHGAAGGGVERAPRRGLPGWQAYWHRISFRQSHRFRHPEPV